MRVKRISITRKKEIDEKVDLALIDPVINDYKNKNGNLIPILQETQNLYGYLPLSVLEKISKETGLRLNDLYGVATFYSHFSLKPKGKYIIKVCDGTACHVKKSIPIVEAIHKKLGLDFNNHNTEDKLFTLELVSCLGACGLAPVVVVNETIYSSMTPQKMDKIIDEIVKMESNNA